jgi:hypothetical protein
MMNRPPEYSRLLRFAGTVLRYYLLAWFCLGVMSLILAGLGQLDLVWVVLAAVGGLLLRFAIFIFCLLAVAVIAEAWRYW